METLADLDPARVADLRAAGYRVVTVAGAFEAARRAWGATGLDAAVLLSGKSDVILVEDESPADGGAL